MFVTNANNNDSHDNAPTCNTRIVTHHERKGVILNRINEAATRVSELCKTKPYSRECLHSLEIVEELTKACHDISLKDPLDKFCEDAPDDDQCKLFE